MISYIKGKITYKSRTDLIVEANGIGYKIHISLNTYDKIANLTEATLLTSYIVREESHSLYGFAEAAEQTMFEQLISVSGVGASTARVILSHFTVGDLRRAIVAEKVDVLRTAKGIGPKSAARIILELKDKIIKDGGIEPDVALPTLMIENPILEEALSSLVVLGFNKIQTQKTLNQLLKQHANLTDTSELIKLALGQLAG